jgi:hypothetical protein
VIVAARTVRFRETNQIERCASLFGFPKTFDGCDFGGLILARIQAMLVADECLHWCEDEEESG